MLKTAYFPDIFAMRSMFTADVIIIDTAEHYQKNSLRNRCFLASSQGRIFLSVPLTKGKHQQMPIRNVRISYEMDWPRQHLSTIENNYKRAPFYEHFITDIHRILMNRPVWLLDLNWEILLFIFDAFKWNPRVSYSLEFDHNKISTIDSRTFIPYPQLFENKFTFIPGLSVLDLLFCIGPQIKYILPAS